MDEDILLNNLEKSGLIEGPWSDKKYSNKAFMAPSIDPETGEKEFLPFYDKSIWRPWDKGVYKEFPLEFLKEAYDKSSDRIEDREQLKKYEEERWIPDRYLIIPEKLRTRVFFRDYDGAPQGSDIEFPNPEYLDFTKANYVAQQRLIDLKRRKAKAEGKGFMSVPIGPVCGQNLPQPLLEADTIPSIVLPVSEGFFEFYPGQRVKKSHGDKITYIVQAGPEPLSKPSEWQYLVYDPLGSEDPSWVKGEILIPMDNKDIYDYPVKKKAKSKYDY